MVQSPKNDFIPLLYQRVGLFKNCCWCEWMIQSRSKDHGSESLHTFRVSSDVDSVWLVTLSFYLVDLKLLWTWYSKVGLWDETIRYYCCSRQDKCYFLRFRQHKRWRKNVSWWSFMDAHLNPLLKVQSNGWVDHICIYKQLLLEAGESHHIWIQEWSNKEHFGLILVLMDIAWIQNELVSSFVLFLFWKNKKKRRKTMHMNTLDLLCWPHWSMCFQHTVGTKTTK